MKKKTVTPPPFLYTPTGDLRSKPQFLWFVTRGYLEVSFSIDIKHVPVAWRFGGSRIEKSIF